MARLPPIDHVLIQLTHEPTNTKAICSAHRSRYQNREAARVQLLSNLAAVQAGILPSNKVVASYTLPDCATNPVDLQVYRRDLA